LREINDDPVITNRVARRTMPATAYSNWKVLAASELNYADYIAGIRAENNKGRVAVNRSIPDSTSASVAIVTRIEHFATKPGFELLKSSGVHAHNQQMPLYAVQ
jgi:hypothetical protein